jgi:hypothetical protein
MSENKALVPVEQRNVEFYGDEILAVLVDDDGQQQIFVPIRPICDLLGIDWGGQYRRIKRNVVLSEALMSVDVTSTDIDPSDRRPRTSVMVCLPLDYIAGFLFTLNPDRVKSELRERVILYQRECYRVLADAFLAPGIAVQTTDEGDQALAQLHNMALVIAATTREMLEVRRLGMDNKDRLDAAREYLRGMNKRLRIVEQRTAAGPLTEEQASEIKKRVNLIAQEMVKYDPSKSHYQTVYAALGEEAGATSYKFIPPKGYEGAITFLDNWLKAMKEQEGKE